VGPKMVEDEKGPYVFEGWLDGRKSVRKGVLGLPRLRMLRLTKEVDATMLSEKIDWGESGRCQINKRRGEKL